MLCAMNSAQYNGSCGKCVNVKPVSGGTQVKVVVWDLCPGCGAQGLDLSDTAFQAMNVPGGLGAGKVQVEWEFVDC